MHQADLLERFPAEGHAIGLYDVGVSGLYFLVKVAHIVGGKAIGTKNADGLVRQPLLYRSQQVSHYLNGRIDDDNVFAPALFQPNVLAGGVANDMIAVENTQPWFGILKLLQPLGGPVG